jgi:phage gp45-like
MSSWEHDDGIRVTTRRGRITKVDDSGTQQLVDLKILKNELPKKVWRPMDFGYFSVPPNDTDGVVVQMGSRSDRTLYLDGGHKDYRPRNRPAGSAGLFDQYGNLLQTDKDHFGVTHAKKINLQIGKGYDAKDAANYSGPTISIVADSNSVTITFNDASFKLESGKATVKAPTVIVDSPDVNLGGLGGTLVGLCGGGCATKVKAV